MIRSIAPGALRLSLLACLATVLGCGDGGAGNVPQATVGGTVSYDGKPVDKGYISLIAEDGEGPTFGAKIAEGKFKVPGVWAGKKRVQVRAGGPPTVATTTAPERGSAVPSVNIPPNAVGNNEVLEIKAGTQTLALKLEKPKA